MSTTRAGVLLVVVVVAGLTVAPLGSAVASPFGTGEESGEAESNATVSTFMHASAADAENAVESELFAARYERADDETRAALVEKRTDDLEAKLANLETEREELRERKDELSTGQYRARMTKLTVDIAALDRSIERTKPRAEKVGVGHERLETLDDNVSKLTGREIAKTANSIPGFERAPGKGIPGATDGRGPPSDRETGPPAEATGGQSNDAGNGPKAKGGNGPPDDSGPQDGSDRNAGDRGNAGNGTGNGGTDAGTGGDGESGDESSSDDDDGAVTNETA